MIYYKIDGDDSVFRNLRNAKRHIATAYNHQMRIDLLSGAYIKRYNDDVVLTETPILVTNDSFSFGKTKRL